MWQERTIPLEWFDQIRWEGENGGEKEKERERIREERCSLFSLDFRAIEPSVWVGARGKVGPRIESYTWVPK